MWFIFSLTHRVILISLFPTQVLQERGGGFPHSSGPLLLVLGNSCHSVSYRRCLFLGVGAVRTGAEGACSCVMGKGSVACLDRPTTSRGSTAQQLCFDVCNGIGLVTSSHHGIALVLYTLIKGVTPVLPPEYPHLQRFFYSVSLTGVGSLAFCYMTGRVCYSSPISLCG